MNSKIIRETSGFPIAFPVLLIFQSAVICFIMIKDHESPWVVIGITAPIALLLFFSRLSIRMDPSHFEYYFFPFMFRRKKIQWNEIREIRLVNTDPVWDFGGWGVITGGNETLFLLLKNGKRRTFSIKSKITVKNFFDEHFIAYEESP